MLPRAVRQWLQRQFASRPQPPFVSHRLELEPLEDRCAASVLYGLGVGANANQLFRFNSNNPAATTTIAVTGLGGNTLFGIDFRPRTGQLIGLGVTGNTTTLFNIDAQTGAATVIGTATVNTLAGATSFGTDFNPTVDRFRVVDNLASDGAGGNANNFRLNPNNGALVLVDADLDFAGPAPGAAPETAVAYLNSFHRAATTTLMGITTGEANDRLVINGGAGPGFATLANVGNLGVDTSANVGFDITGASNTAYAILEVGGVSGLYSINLTSGAATLIGNVGNGMVDFGGLAVVPDSFVAVGSPAGTASSIQVFDAQTNGLIRTITPFGGFTGGVNVAMGDVNRDGTPDIVAGAGAGGGPHVKVFDGKTGTEIASFFAYTSSFGGGVNVAVGDIDGDGFDDVITGAGAGGGPHVKAFSGQGFAEIASFFAYTPTFSGGVSVAAGDLDGDNNGDFEIITGAASGGGPHVRSFQADGTQVAGAIGSFFAYVTNFDGGVNVAAGDVNGDGIAEIITGTNSGSPHVKAFNGTTGAEVFSQFAYELTFTGGVRVSVTDTDADGRFDIETAPGRGRAFELRSFNVSTGTGITTASFQPFGATTTGGTIGGSRF